MIKNLIILPDGTEVLSGTSLAIKSAKVTACVNDGEELSLGSTCPQMLEATLFDIGAKLSLTAGDEVTLYKVNGAGARTKKGIFILEKPTRPSANTLKFTAYDRITKLDKDLTAWLNSLTGWPYDLLTFAGMVCNACGLTLVTTEIPNSDFPVYKPAKATVTGRQLMKWIGEICCRFCRATADGNIEFAWYKSSGVTVGPSGNRYYFQGALSYETYQVAPIEAVQMRLADSESGALWPNVADGTNSYVITGNAILMARVTEDLLPYFAVMEEQLAGVTYTPCKVAIPACLDVDAGSILNIKDKNGKTITTYVMTKTTSGQRDTLECTGSHRRDSASAANGPQTPNIETDKLSVKTVAVHYYLSTSATVLSGGSWSETAPTWTDGKFIWSKTVTTYSDGTTSESDPACITGGKGEDAVVCRIDSSNGYVLKDGDTTTLTARIFVGAEEIDPDGEMDYTWYRGIDGGSYQAFATGKTVTVSEDSYNSYADIYFTTEGGEVAYDDITVVNGVMTIRALANEPVQSGNVLRIT